MTLKAIAVGLLIAAGEVLNGNIRVRIIQRKYGRKKGKQMSFFSGVMIFTVIAWFLLPWIDPKNILDCIRVGLIWVFIMIILDLFFGRFVFRFSWVKILEDFNPVKGNLLGVGMILLLLCPTFIFLLR
jgi:hypothetical protein